jgi:hypothetical protein
MTYKLEDYLVRLHKGQWFGWSDSKNKIYANLIIHDDTKSKPSEADCNAGVVALQKTYDDSTYQRSRANEYPSIADQLDDIYHNGIDAWKTTIKKTKDKYPKP